MVKCHIGGGGGPGGRGGQKRAKKVSRIIWMPPNNEKKIERNKSLTSSSVSFIAFIAIHEKARDDSKAMLS